MNDTDITSNRKKRRINSLNLGKQYSGSNFGGKIEEIDDLVVDDFSEDNWNATIYFLSHCHTDHMRGLFNLDFQRNLVNREGVYLYAEPHTVTILEYKFPQIKSKLKELDIKTNNILSYPGGKKLCVRLIPAGHCPGSVMFLFETDKRILYTGDIRIQVNELKKAVALHDSSGNLKKIDTIYLDTTFFKKSYKTFPTREESVTAFCNLVKPWIRKSKKHIVNYIKPAHYGSEYVYNEIAKTFSMPVHVDSERYETYQHFPEMDDSVTLDGTKTQIHSCKLFKYCEPINEFCENFDRKLVLAIKTSALRWKDADFSKSIVEELCKNYYNVCYSSHSSYTEIIDILNYIKADNIFPCVIPIIEKEREEMLQSIDEIMDGYKPKKEEKVFECKKKFDWSFTIDETLFSSEESDNEDAFAYLDGEIKTTNKSEANYELNEESVSSSSYKICTFKYLP